MWWRTAYSSLYRHPVHALHQYEVRAEHLAGYVCMEALVITGYPLYAVAVGLTGSMYVASITALSACGCGADLLRHGILFISLDLVSGRISGLAISSLDLVSGRISGLVLYLMSLNTCVCTTTRYSGCWRRVGVWGGNPFWYHIGWWSGPGSWGPGGGPGVVPYLRCVASSCGVQACAICLGVVSFFGCLVSSLGFRPFARSVSRASSASLSSLRGPGRGALSLLGSGVGSPGAPWPGTLSGFALNTRARETKYGKALLGYFGPFPGWQHKIKRYE